MTGVQLFYKEKNMNKIKGIICLLFALPLFFTSCEPNKVNATSVMLTADKLTAEIGETVTFTVKYNGEDVTSEAIIKDENSGAVITGNTVTVNTPGESKFTATYQDEKSNVVTVTVTGTPQISLVVDNNVIYAGGEDKATFTVKFGEQDVTAEAVIKNVTSGQAMAKGANTFSSANEGIFIFNAEYNNMMSGDVTVSVAKAPANQLSISATKSRLKADGTDYTTFKVMYLHKDVTADAKIKNVTENKTLSENKFSYSGTLKTVDFTAEYDGKTSNTITIGFGNFYKNTMMMRFTSVFCGPCGSLSATIKEVVKERPDRLLQVAIHSDAMGKDGMTPSQFSDVAQAFPPQGLPTSFFDLNKQRVVVGDMTASALTSKIKDSQNSGASCGISASSVVSGNNAVITVNVTAAKEGTFYLGAILVEDGITGYPQANAPADYVHDNTFRYMASRIGGDKLGEMSENQEMSKTFTFDLKDYKKENCRIVCYVLTDNTVGMRQVTNVISCPIDGSMNYRFEN